MGPRCGGQKKKKKKKRVLYGYSSNFVSCDLKEFRITKSFKKRFSEEVKIKKTKLISGRQQESIK